MKDKIVDLVSSHFYPQNIFAKSILKKIEAPDSIKILIDAPCGNGETSYLFSRNKKLKVLAFDIDAGSIQTAKRRFKANNLEFNQAGIFEVIKGCDSVNYFCIINSLFLLPQPEKILEEIRDLMNANAQLYIIVPNTKGKNFKHFSRDNNEVNKLILSEEELTPYFSKLNFKINGITSIAFTHNYGRKDVKLFSIFSHFYLTFLNVFQTLFKLGQPNYFLISLNKA